MTLCLGVRRASPLGRCNLAGMFNTRLKGENKVAMGNAHHDGQRPSVRIDGHVKSERLAQDAEDLHRLQRVCLSRREFVQAFQASKAGQISDGRCPSL